MDLPPLWPAGSFPEHISTKLWGICSFYIVAENPPPTRWFLKPWDMTPLLSLKLVWISELQGLMEFPHTSKSFSLITLLVILFYYYHQILFSSPKEIIYWFNFFASLTVSICLWRTWNRWSLNTVLPLECSNSRILSGLWRKEWLIADSDETDLTLAAGQKFPAL